MEDNKIKKPSRFFFRSEIFFWLIGIIVITGIVFLFYYLKQAKTSKTITAGKIITGSSIDASFLKPFENNQAAAVPNSLSASAPQPEPIKEPIVEQKKPEVKDYFVLENRPQLPKINPADTINQDRRGTSKVMVSSSALGIETNTTEYIMTQADWKDEPKDMASLPVDMTRVLTADRFINAILLNEINSELGGKVIAQVESNIYGAHGRKILIPAGTKAIGRYNPVKKIGTERLEIVWVRLITPDGINIHTQDAEMTDQMGRSGITGEVDNRYGDKYFLALLATTVGSVGAYAIPVKNNAQAVVIENFGRDQQTFAKKILDEHMEIKPRITIPSGSRILITASRDIWFPEPAKKEKDVYVKEALL